jgi:hypothetical protein
LKRKTLISQKNSLRRCKLRLRNTEKKKFLKIPENTVLRSDTPAGFVRSPIILIKLLMFTLIFVRIAATAIFRHVITLLNIFWKISKMAKFLSHALSTVITGVETVNKSFMVGEKMKFPTLS